MSTHVALGKQVLVMLQGDPRALAPVSSQPKPGLQQLDTQARPGGRLPVGRWFRCYESVMDDPKVLALPADLRWALIVMWCLTSKNGGVLPSMKQIAIGLRVRVDKCARIVEQLEDNGLLTREEFEENGETIEHLCPHNWGIRQHSSKNSTSRVKELRKRRRVSPENPRRGLETDTESVRKNAPAEAKKNVSETAQQQPAAIKAGTVDDHTANLPGAEPFAPDDPWGDLQKDIVFKTETASKGIIPYPDCTALREWKKDGLDLNVVRQVVMEGIKRKPVRTLFYFDKPVRERCQQVSQARAHQSAATPPPEPKPITEEQWTIAVKFFRDIGVWPDDLGPPPDQSGCRAPLDVLESYGFTKAGRRSA